MEGLGKGSEIKAREGERWESQEKAGAGRTEEGRCFLNVKTRFKSHVDGHLGHLAVVFSAFKSLLSPNDVVHAKSKAILTYHK